MKYLIDTNIIIDVLRKKEQALYFLEKCGEHYRPSISVINVIEIIAGLRPEFYEKTKEFLDSFLKFEVSNEIGYLTGSLIYKYARKGKTLHFQDATIAATCIVHKMTLATGNIKDFDFIEELTIASYNSQIQNPC